MPQPSNMMASLAVPHPPLLFIARRHRLAVYALGTNKRPQLDAPIFLAPYFNMFNSDELCIGSMELPDRVNPNDYAEWTRAFFMSNFTHLTGGKRWTTPGTYTQLLDAAAERGSFDPAWLMSAGKNIGDALCSR